MKKFDVVSMLITFTLALILPFSGCQQQPVQPTEPPVPTPDIPPITPEVITCLNQLHKGAMQQIDADIANLDSQIADIEEKELELEQLKNEIDETVTAVDKEIAQKKLETGGWWVFSLPEDEFDYYKNDYYELVKFDLRWDARMEESIWKPKRDIAVMDMETGNTGTSQIFLEELRRYRSELVASKEAKLEHKGASEQLLSEVIAHKDGWKIEEISKGVYKVSGYGLGYTGQLSLGEWYHFEESRSIEPKTQAAISLRDAITGG